MAKYVAFLRGINVGGRTIKMAELKTCLDKAGLNNVKTVLQTGNVIFESGASQPKLKDLIEKTLAKTFDYPAKVQVISMDDLQKIIKAYPFAAKDGFHSYVVFMENDLEAALVAEAGRQLGEKVERGKGVVYWQVARGDTLKSDFAKLLTKSKYKEFNTNRNLNTLNKIINS